MNEKKMAIKKEVIRYCFMVLGCVLFAAGLSLFLIPNAIITGGVTGLATIVYRFTNIGVGVLSWVFNLPILLFGVTVMGKRFIANCLITSATLSVFVDLFSTLPPFTDDKIMASLYGGLFIGASIGLFYKYSMSSGGSELLARLLRKKFKTLSMGAMLGLLDGFVVIAGALVLKSPETILYALIVIFISSKISDGFISGFQYSKLCYIITDMPKEISEALLKSSQRGITLLDGVGMYTNTKRNILMTVVKKRDFVMLKEIIQQIDPMAFIIVSETNEVLGKGFKDLNNSD